MKHAQNIVLENVMKNQTEKGSKKSENCNYLRLCIVPMWNELDDTLMCTVHFLWRPEYLK
jgi:hypothetical protein